MPRLTNAELAQEVADLRSDNQMLNLRLEESLTDRLIQLEDMGWTQIFGGPQPDEESGPTLEQLTTLTKQLRPEAATNPLHIRGAQLRHSYVFGRGIYFTGLDNKVKAYVEDPYNKQALFSMQAFETNNKALFTDGNLIVLRDEGTNKLTIVPISQITSFATDPDDNSNVRYLKREWSTNGKAKALWYPISRFKKSRVGRGKRRSQTGGIQKSFTQGGKTVAVSQDTVAYLHTSNRQSGWTFGLPDSLGAFVWSAAYKAYLMDNAKLVKALSQLAWKFSAASKAGADTVAASVKTASGVASSAVMGQGNDVSAVSRGNDVNFNNGQPLAAMVATSLGVPVIALLSSPGATGGSYGAATTLDTPTIKGMKSLQDCWKELYVEIITDMGAVNPLVSFPNISQDETYREAQTIGLAYADGRLFQDEARDATLDLLDVKKLHDGTPKPDEFNAGGDKNDPSNPAPGQGNAGAAPGGVDQNTSNHDND